MSAPPTSLLSTILEAIPPPNRGVRLVEEALELAGRVTLPTDPTDMRLFLAGALRAVLAEELGSRFADEVLLDIEAEVMRLLGAGARETIPAAPSAKRLSARPVARRVLVLSDDRTRSAPLIRALLREGLEVATANDVSELDGALTERPSVLVLEERVAHDLPRRLRKLLEMHDEIGVVVHDCTSPGLAEALIRSHGTQNVVTLGRSTATTEVVAAVRGNG